MDANVIAYAEAEIVRVDALVAAEYLTEQGRRALELSHFSTQNVAPRLWALIQAVEQARSWLSLYRTGRTLRLTFAESVANRYRDAGLTLAA